jgi:hypothetical protein
VRIFPRCSPFQIIRLSCLRMGVAKDCGSAAAYVLAVPSGDASQSWESRRSEIGMQHDQFLIHTGHGLLFWQRLSFMLNAAPQVRVDIHLGKLRQGRFIPGPVGKSAGAFCFAMSAVCAFKKSF